jgi:DNA polymerase elongation subunit (family B)
VAAALSGDDGFEIVLDGDEAKILAGLDRALAAIEPGIIVTWNGAAFDLPFIDDRARRLEITIGLRLRLDPTIPRRDPLPGHAGAYRARWHDHRHIDGYQLFRADVGAAMNLPCGLKALAGFVGLPIVEVDRATIHELDAETTRRYVASDARLARSLVLRRLATAVSAVDVMPT